MTATPRPHPIDELLALHQRLAADRGRDGHALLVRDRAIGRELAGRQGAPFEQLRGWLHRVDAGALRDGTAGRALSALSAMLAVLGLLVGAGAARALLHYDGSQPVNLLPVLVVLVGFQLALLLTLVFVALPVPWQRRLPGVSALSDLLMLLSPGRWAGALARRLPAGWRLDWSAASGSPAVDQAVSRWAMLSLSQVFAVAFNIAVLAVMFFLLATRDIAFGWSSTLHFEPGSLQRVLAVLALPWVWIADAQPSLVLLEATRIYRPWDPPADLTPYSRWWSFLILAVLVYGLLPRVLLLLFARARLRAAVRESMLDLPGVARVLGRLNSELVETTSPERDPGARQGGADVAGADAGQRFDGCRAFVVDWAGAVGSQGAETLLRERFGVRVLAGAAAGGRLSLEDDRALVERVATLDARDIVVFVVVKAWELLTHEIVEFIEAVVAARHGGPVVVLPVSRDESERASVSVATDAAVWRARLAAADTAGLFVDGGEPA